MVGLFRVNADVANAHRKIYYSPNIETNPTCVIVVSKVNKGDTKGLLNGI